MSITAQIKRLKGAGDQKKMLEVYEEIKVLTNKLSFPSADFKKKYLQMLYDSIETYIAEFNPNGDNYHNSKVLDTFYVLDDM